MKDHVCVRCYGKLNCEPSWCTHKWNGLCETCESEDEAWRDYQEAQRREYLPHYSFEDFKKDRRPL